MADLAVRGLRDLWADLTGGGVRRAEPASPRPMRPMLDTLGLRLGQTLAYLGRERPSWNAFQAWVRATGDTDAAAIARYNAWFDGKDSPRRNGQGRPR